MWGTSHILFDEIVPRCERCNLFVMFNVNVSIPAKYRTSSTCKRRQIDILIVCMESMRAIEFDTCETVRGEMILA